MYILNDYYLKKIKNNYLYFFGVLDNEKSWNWDLHKGAVPATHRAQAVASGAQIVEWRGIC